MPHSPLPPSIYWYQEAEPKVRLDLASPAQLAQYGHISYLEIPGRIDFNPISRFRYHDLRFKIGLKKILKEENVSYDTYRTLPINDTLRGYYKSHCFSPRSKIYIHENDFVDYKSDTLNEISPHYRVTEEQVEKFNGFMETILEDTDRTDYRLTWDQIFNPEDEFENV